MDDATKRKRSYAMGYLTSICGLVVSFPDKQPTAFFYGHVAKDGETPTHTFDGVDYVGVVLPKLPEWDKTVYPYVTIMYSGVLSYGATNPEYDLLISSSKCRYLDYTSGRDLVRAAGWGIMYGLDPIEDTNWGDGYVYGASPDNPDRAFYTVIASGNQREKLFVYSNYNVVDYNTDEVIHPADDDPVPVYE